MAAIETPRYIYKIVPSSAPVSEPLPERLPVSELDQNSGFIHLSTAAQVPNTLKFFFKDEPLVYMLRIDYERVSPTIRWESPDGKVCGPRPQEGLFPVSQVFPEQVEFSQLKKALAVTGSQMFLHTYIDNG